MNGMAGSEPDRRGGLPDPDEEYETNPVRTTDVNGAGADADVLLLKDCHPWQNPANEAVLSDLDVPYRVAPSSDLSAITLEEFETVVLPSTQPGRFYNRLNSERDALDSFVANGGTLLVRAVTRGFPCEAYTPRENFIPGGVEWALTYGNLELATPDHPIVEDQRAADIDGFVIVSGLGNVPDHATVITRMTSTGTPHLVEYDHGDGKVIVNGHIVEWFWYPRPGWWRNRGYTNDQFLENELDYALNHGSDETVSASFTAVHYINGKNENFSEGGHPLDSAQMQVFRRSETLGVSPVGPVIDNWQKGDMVDELPDDLDEALKQKRRKNVDEFGDEPFNKYRFRNQIEVTFEASTDATQIDEDSVEITFAERGFVDDETVTFKNNKESYTVLVNPDLEDVDDPDDANINNLLGNGWFDLYDNLRERGTRQPRYYRYGTTKVDGVEAVRVSTISGAYAGFSKRIAELGKEGPSFFNELWDWGYAGKALEELWIRLPEKIQALADFFAVVPYIYSFLDFFVLVDGRRFARVWDASSFPSLAMYVDGIRRGQDFVDYEPRERLNSEMLVFFAQAIANGTPYHAPELQYYLQLLRDDDKREKYVYQSIGATLDIFSQADVDPRDIIEPFPLATFGYDAEGDRIENPDELLPDDVPNPLDVRVTDQDPDGPVG